MCVACDDPDNPPVEHGDDADVFDSLRELALLETAALGEVPAASGLDNPTSDTTSNTHGPSQQAGGSLSRPLLTTVDDLRDAVVTAAAARWSANGTLTPDQRDAAEALARRVIETLEGEQ